MHLVGIRMDEDAQMGILFSFELVGVSLREGANFKSVDEDSVNERFVKANRKREGEGLIRPYSVPK